MRRAARVDENQLEIVTAWRKAGATVTLLHAVGDGCPDCLVGYRGVNYLAEIKNPLKPKADRQLTPVQEVWHMMWRGQKAIVTNVDEAIELISEKRK